MNYTEKSTQPPRNYDKAATLVKSSPTTCALDNLESVSIEIVALVGRFEERLQFVLSPALPETAANEKSDCSNVPLLRTIEEHTTRLRYCSSDLERILNRLAL